MNWWKFGWELLFLVVAAIIDVTVRMGVERHALPGWFRSVAFAIVFWFGVLAGRMDR